jgi:hypothetical protein
MPSFSSKVSFSGKDALEVYHKTFFNRLGRLEVLRHMWMISQVLVESAVGHGEFSSRSSLPGKNDQKFITNFHVRTTLAMGFYV